MMEVQVIFAEIRPRNESGANLYSMLPHDDAPESVASARALAQRALELIAELRRLEIELKGFLASAAADRLHMDAEPETEQRDALRDGSAPVAYKGPMRWARG